MKSDDDMSKDDFDTIHIDDSCEETDINNNDTEKSEKKKKKKREFQKVMSRISSHQIQTVMKCKALGIKFDPIKVFEQRGGTKEDRDERANRKDERDDGDMNNMDDTDNTMQSRRMFYKCQSCNQTLIYTCNEDVYKHLYGSDERNGCCWNLIHSKHVEIIKSIIEKEGIHIIDGLLHVLFQNAANHEDKGKDKDVNGSSSSALNWVDVITLMEEELNKRSNRMSNSVSSYIHNSNNNGNIKIRSDELSGQGEDYTKKITVHDNILPIALNRDILEVVTRHVVNRYGVCGEHDFSNP